MDQDKAEFLAQLRELGTTLTEYVSTNGSDWSIKGFIDIDQNVYTISSDRGRVRLSAKSPFKQIFWLSGCSPCERRIQQVGPHLMASTTRMNVGFFQDTPC